MSDIFKIIGVGMIGGILALSLRGKKPEFAMLVSVITSLVIVGQIFMGLQSIVSDIHSVIKESGVDIKYFGVCIKAVGIAYISQFAAELLYDSGEGAVASKVETAGKVSILIITMPVMLSFLRLCMRIINEI